MDARTTQSRTAILDAFRQRIFEAPYEDIRVNDLISTAGIARSTFYKYFPDKRAVLIAAMDHLLIDLAHCATGSANRPDIEALVQHLWENRNLGRVIFTSNAMDQIVRTLADRIEEGSDQPKLNSYSLAYSLLGSVKGWISGEFYADEDDLVNWLLSFEPICSSKVLASDVHDQRPL